MGFFKKIGRGISKGIKKIGKGVSKALNSTVGKIATTALQFVPGVGLATKLLGAAASIGQKGVKFEDLSGKGKTTTTPQILDAGEGALLWKFSKKKDTWELQKGNPVNVNVDDKDYQWNGTFYETLSPVIEDDADTSPILREDIQLTYEMLDGNLHIVESSKNYRGNRNRAHGLYLAAREVFGSENNVIFGLGGSAKSQEWKTQIKKIESGRDEDALLDIVNVTLDNIEDGGTGYIDDNGAPFVTKFRNTHQKPWRKVVEETPGGNNTQQVFIQYDDLLYNLDKMDARKNFILAKKAKIKSTLVKAWRNEPTSRRRQNILILDRSVEDWKRDIDKVVPGSGINKTRGLLNNGIGFFGRGKNQNLDWIDLMRLLNQTARAERKLGQGQLPELNGNIGTSNKKAKINIGTSGYARRKARERAAKG